MTDVGFSSSGPPNTVLPDLSPELAERLVAASASQRPRNAVAALVAEEPTFLEGWAKLGELSEEAAYDDRGNVEAYAYFRIGYHRGLDALRKNGWRGSGYVRWEHPSNLGFLRCLDGLRKMAEVIGETHEAERCSEFLSQLDPTWKP
jgi:hypothetical protein